MRRGEYKVYKLQFILPVLLVLAIFRAWLYLSANKAKKCLFYKPSPK
jgi:hypothetical protein